MKKAIFPGSFDPFHDGHNFVVQSAIEDGYEKIYIVVSWNENKIRTNSFEKSANEIKKRYKNNNKIKVMINKNELTVDICKKLDCYNIIRGYRDDKDLDYERELKKIYIKAENKINFILYKSNLNIRSNKLKNDIIKSD
ncbi:MAG: adenylyltransferase/cytidyltransferase family protein [Mycoplasma sp.]|nr:adenylyltransferase/cytidyltransferase family protein [Mycoplasma sp.]